MTPDSQAPDAKLLQRIDERTEWICKAIEGQQKCDDDHERRIRAIENQQSRWLGRDGVIVTGIASLVSLLVACLATFVGCLR
ncbi:hypothetical protein [Methanogenium cariaci]|jgi:hypothetical protein|uniref:hypothetical protein n=1 Tax=Methanogenium cariaci TaxID=2197 RepID=UPI0007805296|nr:hypothetical protein [Methanogenium cariaci]